MRVLVLLMLILAALVAGATSCLAGPLRPGALNGLAWFYNRPGATPPEVESDYGECVDFGGRMFNTVGAHPVGLLAMGALAMISPGPVGSYADDCMISKGYRRFNVEASNGRRAFLDWFKNIPPETQLNYAGADNPSEGTLAREWMNTYWLSDETPASVGRRFSPHTLDLATGFKVNRPTIRPVADGAAISADSTQAVIVLTMQSSAGKVGRLYFARDNNDTGAPDFVTVGRDSQWPVLEARVEANETAAKTFVFVVPAGAYALTAIHVGWDFTNFCLGTVAFRANPGEVIDLGNFTIAPGTGAPYEVAPSATARLRIDQPAVDSRRALFPATATNLAERMRQASYVNGFPHGCSPLHSAAYGFDLPGAAMWNAGTAPAYAAPAN